MSSFKLTVAIPMHNEEKNIIPLLHTLLPIIEQYDYELICVDDGSKDKTLHILKDIAQHNKRIKIYSFYRNFGHQVALTCAYMHATGNCVITMDADLQDPPAIIPKMVEKWHNGAKIVYAKRKKRETDTFFKRTTAHLFYDFINALSDIPIPYDVGDFRLIDKEVVTFLNELPERSRFLRGLVAWGGFPTDYVYFARGKRHAGRTHYTLSKMVNFAIDGITSFSAKPLRLASYAGFFAAGLGFLGVVYAVIGRLFFPQYLVTGWAALFVGIMFIGGVQLITIGIIGEYLNKIYQEIHRRPHFLLRETVNAGS